MQKCVIVPVSSCHGAFKVNTCCSKSQELHCVGCNVTYFTLHTGFTIHEKEIWIRVVFLLALIVRDSSLCLMMRKMSKYSKFIVISIQGEFTVTCHFYALFQQITSLIIYPVSSATKICMSTILIAKVIYLQKMKLGIVCGCQYLVKASFTIPVTFCFCWKTVI